MDIHAFKYRKSLEKEKGDDKNRAVHEMIQMYIIMYDQWQAQMLQTIQKKAPLINTKDCYPARRSNFGV